MKTRADLLVRDALAGVFVRACAGEASARTQLEALQAWNTGKSADENRLREIRTEHDQPLFGAQGQLQPPFRMLEDYVRDRALRMHTAVGWLAEVQQPDDLVEQARAAWDAGLFFEVHELLEPPWLEAEGERKLALQGLILAGAGLYHLTRDNLAGARGLLFDAERKLIESPYLGTLDLRPFARGLGALASALQTGKLAGWQEVEELPRF